MKKLFTLLLALVMVISMVACAGQGLIRHHKPQAVRNPLKLQAAVETMPVKKNSR